MYLHTQIQRDTIFAAKKIRCLLVHDHVLLRQGLRRLLQDESDLEVVAEASNAAEALRKVFEQRPDVVLTGADIFGLEASDVERLIRRECPHSKVLLLSRHAGEEAEAQTGGTGCAARYTRAEELVEMVRNAHFVGGLGMNAGPAERSEVRAAEDVAPRKRVLTAREREVLKLLAEGKTVRSAADALGLSAKTVDAHKFNLMRKLNIHNKVELVMWAIQKNVVKIPANT